MKALVYTGIETLDYRDAPEPVARSGEALIRIDAVGICGSDMHAFLGHDDRRPAPLILGHEGAGLVISGEDEWIDRRVTINPLVTCGTCRYCAGGRANLCQQRQIISMPPRQGAFSQFVAMPVENLVEVPSQVAIEKAALAEPIACGWHAVRLASQTLEMPFPDAKILVIGGGAIGLGAALCARAFGAQSVTVIETNAIRHGALEAEGFAIMSSPDEIADASFDCIVDGVGYAATRQMACRAAAPGGVISHIGLGGGESGLDVRRMTLQEITFIGTYTYTPQDFRDTCAAIFDGKLGNLEWTEERPLSEGQAAFADIRSGSVANPKVILRPN
jgi:L-iditol 2-dehydrogenase